MNENRLERIKEYAAVSAIFDHLIHTLEDILKENEIKDSGCQRELLTPRLINLYFWLIDYFVAAKENVSKMNDIITRIKILDTDIYELYIK